MPDTEIRSKTELTSIDGTEYVYTQMSVPPYTVKKSLLSTIKTWINSAVLAIASTAESQAGTDNTKAISPLRLREGLNAYGSAPVYTCRAWVNFNGTGTVAIRASGNVSSITDNGTGDYTLNFTTSLEDANYSVSCVHTSANLANEGGKCVIAGTIAGGATLKSTSQLRIQTYSSTSTLSDYAEINCQIFR